MNTTLGCRDCPVSQISQTSTINVFQCFWPTLLLAAERERRFLGRGSLEHTVQVTGSHQICGQL